MIRILFFVWVYQSLYLVDDGISSFREVPLLSNLEFFCCTFDDARHSEKLSLCVIQFHKVNERCSISYFYPCLRTCSAKSWSNQIQIRLYTFCNIQGTNSWILRSITHGENPLAATFWKIEKNRKIYGFWNFRKQHGYWWQKCSLWAKYERNSIFQHLSLVGFYRDSLLSCWCPVTMYFEEECVPVI